MLSSSQVSESRSPQSKPRNRGLLLCNFHREHRSWPKVAKPYLLSPARDFLGHERTQRDKDRLASRVQQLLVNPRVTPACDTTPLRHSTLHPATGSQSFTGISSHIPPFDASGSPIHSRGPDSLPPSTSLPPTSTHHQPATSATAINTSPTTVE